MRLIFVMTALIALVAAIVLNAWLGVATEDAEVAAKSNLPPVSEPAENLGSEAKRVLGKILFWDEQLSFNDTIACGSCHRPEFGGADPRSGIHPGTDPGTIDNVRGSPGIVALDHGGNAVEDEVFGFGPQITTRISPSNFGTLWATEIFWDGRAGPGFDDPLTGNRLIETGGALEAQAIASLSNPAEMTNRGHDWQQLVAKLADRQPLALAENLPPDIRNAISRFGTYPALFAAAFSDSEITPARIAYAIASYQRTLIADQSPWDLYQSGDTSAMTESQIRGWQAFQDFRCVDCHTPPLFTNNAFVNIGLRRSLYDGGRMAVTGDAADAGRMKVPSLRNVGLRPRFMHTGQFDNLGAAVNFYISGAALEDRDEMPTGGVYAFNMSTFNQYEITEFLQLALTDPRVQNETFPFDRPQLRAESGR